jgi:small subunit ribosomal protein S1
MEIYKDLSNPVSKEFEKLLNSQFTKSASLEEGKIISGIVKKLT